jgi:mercuric ion transport protein
MMKNKLRKTGIVGTIVITICCFTPFLVWVLSVVGLASLVAYLDIVILPLLAFFIVLLSAGLVVALGGKNKNYNKLENTFHSHKALPPSDILIAAPTTLRPFMARQRHKSLAC